MADRPITILLVEDNPGDIRLLYELIQEVAASDFLLSAVGTLAQAIAWLDHDRADVILVDLSLPDSQGLETFTQLAHHVSGIPVIVLTGFSDDAVAVAAMQQGAQDYLIKGQVDGPLLVQSMRYAIERERAEEALRRAKNDLELRVAERTAELLRSHQHLKAELQERQRAQEALRISQARFAGILEVASDAIISIDAQQRITLFNQGAEHIFGYTAVEVLGQPLDVLIPDRSITAHHQYVQDFGLTETESRRMGNRREVAGRRKDGSEFPAEASISKLDLGSEQVFTVILRDVTERKRADDALRSALQQLNFHVENSPLAVIEWDHGFRVSRWSAAAERIFQWSLAEVLGQHPREWPFVFEEDWPIVQGVMHRLSQGIEQCNIAAFRNYRKDGSVIDCEWYNSALINEAGCMESVLSLALDVTDRQKVERMKDEFVSVVSHELRTPLTSIHGSLGLLASGMLSPDSERGKRLLQIAVESTDRLVRLINDILDIERIESGKATMTKSSCAVPELLAQAINTMQPLADEVKMTLSVASVSAYVLADSDRIIQVLTNLISNAIKFSSPNQTISLRTELQESTVLFSVKDQGRGIPPDKRTTIFERFQQVDSSDSRNHEGTGLGLAICRSIIQQHRGEIWVESQLGEGSTFYFTLPIAAAPVDPSHHRSPVPALPAPSNHQQAAALVLVCDDDETVQLMVQMVLLECRYRVVTVGSGSEAITCAIAQKPDVIVLDLRMPEMDGWEVINSLRARSSTRSIPVILCGSEPPSDWSVQREDRLVWLNKPFDESQFMAALQQALVQAAQPVRVLIVEDDASLAEVLSTLFSRHNIEAIQAANGIEAIQLSQQVRPDMVILDVMLPQKDGFEVVEWLRQHRHLNRVPMIVYSAKDLTDEERDRLQLGPTEFLTKSRVSTQEFEARVMAILQNLTHSQS